MGRPSLNGYLLDTHIWLWYLTTSDKLPRGLRAVIDRNADRCRLSPLSIWEAGVLVARGRFRIRATFPNWVDEALEALPLQDAPLSKEVAVEASQVRLEHGDPVDHLLVGTALAYDLTLMTVDRILALSDVVKTRSN